MQGFLHQLLSGLANGGIYASVALALMMIYQATHLVNFAAGRNGDVLNLPSPGRCSMPGFLIGRLSALRSSSRSLPVSPSNGSSSRRWNTGRC